MCNGAGRGAIPPFSRWTPRSRRGAPPWSGRMGTRQRRQCSIETPPLHHSWGNRKCRSRRAASWVGTRDWNHAANLSSRLVKTITKSNGDSTRHVPLPEAISPLNILAMESETLNCPMCGAPAAADATRCEHCGARLATVQCPSCFGMMFVGAKFCSHCGARADRTEVPGAPHENCPRCHIEMDAVEIGNTNLRECPRCGGVWADLTSLQQICADRERQAAVIGMASPP